MPRGYKLSQQEAAERLGAHFGYELLSAYQRKDQKVQLKCPRHGCILWAEPANIWKGRMLACCAREANSERGRLLCGTNNPFCGRSHSVETKEKISRAKLASPLTRRGHSKPANLIAANILAYGVPRPPETREKIRKGIVARYKFFDFCARKAECGKTAGRAGIFYIVRIGDHLKFGSATSTMHYRLVRLRQRYGEGVERVMHCIVADAGAYEAAMMRRYREFWLFGERFRDFLLTD